MRLEVLHCPGQLLCLADRSTCKDVYSDNLSKYAEQWTTLPTSITYSPNRSYLTILHVVTQYIFTLTL